MSNDKARYIATCPSEHRDVLGTELAELGAEDIVSDFRSVYFSADIATCYAAHLKLRAASALHRIIKVVRVPTEDNIYRQCLRIDWQEIFADNSSFRVDGVDADRSGEGLPAQVVSKKIRLAICAYFQKHKLPEPKVSLTDPRIVIIGYNQQHKCIVSVNTSGLSMHKRGYRVASAAHPAPLKETLAASILLKIGYRGQKPLLDVMCGSGTIAIEAAMIALNQAPLWSRSNNQFAFTQQRDFSNAVWRDVRDKVQAEKKTALAHPIVASDIEGRYVQLAQDNAKRARVERFIDFRKRAYDQVEGDATQAGVVIANLPYGDRMAIRDLRGFYQQIGNWLKRSFVGWEAVMITSASSPYQHIGLRPHKKYSFHNGKIEILALVFELYAGSRKRMVAR